MKKMNNIILALLILLLPIGVFAKDANVTIESITKEETTGNAQEIIPVSFSGTNINLNLKFEEVGDSIKYKIVFNSRDNEDYQLTLDQPDEYVIYTLSSNVIKKSTTTEIILTAKYNKEMPVDQRGQAISKVVKVNIKDNNEKVLNPKTGQSIVFILVALLVLVISLYAIKTKKVQTLIIAAVLLLIPASVFALNNLILTINTTYEIEEPSLEYKGIRLTDSRLEEDMQEIKDELECRCGDEVIEIQNEINSVISKGIAFEATSENAADVKLIYPNEIDNIGVQTSVSIETDAETGESRFAVGECHINPEIPYTNFTYAGKALADPTRLVDYAQDEMCPRIRELLESLDTECVRKLIHETQDTTQQETEG